MAYLYEIRIRGGINNPNWQTLFQNMLGLNAQASGSGGIQSACVLGHDMDADFVHVLCTNGFNGNLQDVMIAEITRKTLRSNQSPHIVYRRLVGSYFLPIQSRTYAEIKLRLMGRAIRRYIPAHQEQKQCAGARR